MNDAHMINQKIHEVSTFLSILITLSLFRNDYTSAIVAYNKINIFQYFRYFKLQIILHCKSIENLLIEIHTDVFSNLLLVLISATIHKLCTVYFNPKF